MKKAKESISKSAILRQKAEEKIGKDTSYSAADIANGDMMKLIHELQVHQVELQMQNEELIMAVAKAETATELYDLAPAGYFTLLPDGKIVELNLSGARLLGKERSKLVECNFKEFIAPDSLIRFNDFLNSIFETGERQTSEVQLSINGDAFYILINGKPSFEKDKCLLLTIDFTERKKAEDKLLASEATLRAITDAAQDAILMIDPAGNISFLNPAAERIFGYSTNEMLGKNLHFLLSPERYHNPHQEAFKLFLQTGEGQNLNKTRELQAIHKDGHEIFIELSISASEHPDGRYVVGVIRDISERKVTELALQKSRKEFQSYFDTAAIGMSVTAPDKSWIEVNQKLCQILGRSKEEVTGISWVELSHPDDIEDNSELFQKVLDGKIDKYEHEKRFLRKDGSILYVNLSTVCQRNTDGSVNHFLTSYNDITDRKLAENELKTSEERYLRILNTVDEIIYSLRTENDPLNQIVEFVSSRSEQILGYTSDEFITNQFQWLSVIHPDDLQSLTEITLQAYQTKQNLPRTYRMKHKHTGEYIWIEDLPQFLFDEEGEISGVFGSARNISGRKHAEGALMESEAIYRKLIEKIPDGVYKSTHDGRFVEVNPAMVSILGYDSKEELLAIDIKKELYFDPSDRDSLTLDEMREELGIFRLRKKDGSEIWVEDHGWYTSSESGETLYHEGVIRDVTGRIQAEDALHESELVHLKLIERIPDGVYKTTHEGKFVEINPAMVSMLGYENKEELMAIDIKTQLYFDPDDRESIILEQKQREMGIYRLRKKDGSELWVEDHGWYTTDENGEILFHEGVMRDITDRKNAEEALKESQLLFQNLTLVSPSGIFRSTVDGYFTYVNPRWSELSGLSFDEAVGYGWLRAVHPDDREQLSDNWSKDVSFNKPSTAEYRFLKPDGSIVNVIGFAVPEIKDNIINGFIGTITDITERKLAEEEIISLNATLEQRVIHRTAQLEAANKELEAFGYSISHDLRTPLRALDGFANFLLEDYSKVLDAEGKRMLQVIIDNANKMGFLIDDLLAFSRLSRYKLKIEQIDMKAMAYSVYHELTSSSGKEAIDFRLQNIPNAVGDPSMIRQVWLNLISNAIKYTSKKQNRVIEVSFVNKGNENIYIVKDNGAGFSMDYYNKMFGVFQRLHTTKDFEGTGIGLAIVNRIVNRHHGRVWAEGEVGVGATFSFMISNKP